MGCGLAHVSLISNARLCSLYAYIDVLAYAYRAHADVLMSLCTPMPMSVYMRAEDVDMFMDVGMGMDRSMCTWTCMCTRMGWSMYPEACIRICLCVCVCACGYAFAYAYAHVCVCMRVCVFV